MENFQKSITLNATSSKVFDALTNSISQWWTEMFEGAANKQEDTFTIRFGANVFKTMKVEELIHNKKVVWKVTDSLIDLPGLNKKTEWINTKIVWKIISDGSKTELQLTHIGLTPQIECYTICESGWQNFTNSLAVFINTGIGMPFKKSQ